MNLTETKEKFIEATDNLAVTGWVKENPIDALLSGFLGGIMAGTSSTNRKDIIDGVTQVMQSMAALRPSAQPRSPNAEEPPTQHHPTPET